MIPARNWQGTADPARTVARAKAKPLARSMRSAFKQLRMLVNVKELAHHLRQANARAAAESIALDHYREVLKEPFGIIGSTFEDAAHVGAKRIATAMRRGGHRLRYRPRKADAGEAYAFDRFDERTQGKLRDYQDELIAQLDTDARDTVETMIMDGVRYGTPMDEVAANIRSTISLTDRQAQAVANYRRSLEDLDPSSLDRALRDTGYDAAVQDAIDSGDYFSSSAIDNMVDAYADNYLDYRAATIADTESLRASNMGLRDSYQQAADRGVFSADAVTRHWQIAANERVCPICRSIVENNPDGVGLDEDFQSDDGPEDDPPVHANCQCTVDYVTDLDAQTDEES